jgi:hypothetical protein
MPEQDAPREPIQVEPVVATMLDQMAGIAWIKLGLQPDPMTGKLEPIDLDQAKLAVDVTAALAAALEPSLDEDDRRQLQNLVRDLRLNFVAKQRDAQ